MQKRKFYRYILKSCEVWQQCYMQKFKRNKFYRFTEKMHALASKGHFYVAHKIKPDSINEKNSVALQECNFTAVLEICIQKHINLLKS